MIDPVRVDRSLVLESSYRDAVGRDVLFQFFVVCQNVQAKGEQAAFPPTSQCVSALSDVVENEFSFFIYGSLLY